MTDNLITLINQYKQAGILIDTNILLLLFVGNADPKKIQLFKRTAQFAPEDHALLSKLLSYFARIVSTPNILSEVSSLSGQLGEPFKREFFVSFSKEIELVDERYIRSIDVARMDEFAKFGLTDSATIDLSNQRFLVLTDDFRLSQYLSRNNIDAINFNHIRVPGWT